MTRFASVALATMVLVAFSQAQTPAGVPRVVRDQPAEIQLNVPGVADAATLVTFLGIDVATGQEYVLNSGATYERYTPFSTFKIANYLIAIETGVIADPQAIYPWNPVLRPRATHWPDDWARDHSLQSAFRASAVWFFQDIALSVGADRYRELLHAFGYGNASVGDDDDGFWLDGTLRVSPREQVAFLARVLAGELGLRAETHDQLRTATLLRSDLTHDAYGKTGAGPLDPESVDGAFGGWLVGWVETVDEAPFIFALYLEAPSFRDVWAMRSAATLDLLQQAGALPSDWR